MGCHTWSYIKTNVSKEVREQMISDFNKEYNKLMYLSPEELLKSINEEMMRKYPDLDPSEVCLDCTLEEFTKDIKRDRKYMRENKVLEHINSGDFTYFQLLLLFKKYIGDGEHNIIFYKDEFYVANHAIAGDMFRVRGYPKDKFTDAETLISWLKEREYVGYYNDKCEDIGFCDELCEKIRNAFREHPDLLIDFG